MDNTGPLGQLFPRFNLLFRHPSKISPLNRLSREIVQSANRNVTDTPLIWYKREDAECYGFSGDGSQGRKLEYVIPGLLALGGKVMVTTAGQSSNHIRDIAVAAAAAGLKLNVVSLDASTSACASEEDRCEGMLQIHILETVLGVPSVTSFRDTTSVGGVGLNLDHAMKFAAIPYDDTRTFETRFTRWLRTGPNGGHRLLHIVIPSGRSTHHLAGLGYAHFAFEIFDQERELHLHYDRIYVACTHGSTLGGMIAGFKLLQQRGLRSEGVKLIGVASGAEVNEYELRALVLIDARRTASLIGVRDVNRAITHADVMIDMRWKGVLHGRLDDYKMMLARQEAIVIDPIPTGRLFLGMMHAATTGEPLPGQLPTSSSALSTAQRVRLRDLEPVTASSSRISLRDRLRGRGQTAGGSTNYSMTIPSVGTRNNRGSVTSNPVRWSDSETTLVQSSIRSIRTSSSEVTLVNRPTTNRGQRSEPSIFRAQFRRLQSASISTRWVSSEPPPVEVRQPSWLQNWLFVETGREPTGVYPLRPGEIRIPLASR